LIQACLSANPVLEIVVSFYSPSGMQHYHKRGFEPYAVFYLPADTPQHMQRLIKVVQADRLYLLKYEFWPNLLQKAQEAGLEVFGVSTILRPSQVYFKWYGGFFRRALKRVAHFAVQNEATQKRLLALGISSQKIEVLGDLRFNRVLEAKASAKPNPIIAQFVGTSPLLILGSSWPQEEKILNDFMDNHKEILTTLNLKVLIAPHDLSDSHLLKLFNLFPDAIRYSKQDQYLNNTDVLILDTIGHLSAAYQYGSVAFVGGGFSGSLHNILEPLAYGLPVLFGPKHEKFPEAQQFIDLGFAQAITDAKGLEKLLILVLEKREISKSAIETQVFNLQGKISTLLID
jgi:3-deoxy-D-manno-octulosonic-acid transferase